MFESNWKYVTTMIKIFLNKIQVNIDLLITFEGCSNIYSPSFDMSKFVEKTKFLELQIVMHEVAFFFTCL
jgi:hypothetical protein